MYEPDFVQGTLDWCNERREAKKLSPLDKLPKGRRGDPNSCPCGKATGLSVIKATYLDEKTGGSGSTSPAVRRFITEFDAGRLPEYEEDPNAPEDHFFAFDTPLENTHDKPWWKFWERNNV